MVGEVAYVDRFGTLVTNLTLEMVPDYAVTQVEGLDIGPLRRTFGDVPTGGAKLVCRRSQPVGAALGGGRGRALRPPAPDTRRCLGRRPFARLRPNAQPRVP